MARKMLVDLAAKWLAAPAAFRCGGVVPPQFVQGRWFFLADTLVVKSVAVVVFCLAARS